MSSSIDQLNTKELDEQNKYIEEAEKVKELHIDVHTLNYKDNILDTFKMIEDPFSREIKDFTYD